MLPALILLTSAGCADADAAGNPSVAEQIVEVSLSYSPRDDGLSARVACGVTVEPSVFDFSGCCPAGWVFLALGTSGVLCVGT